LPLHLTDRWTIWIKWNCIFLRQMVVNPWLASAKHAVKLFRSASNTTKRNLINWANWRRNSVKLTSSTTQKLLNWTASKVHWEQFTSWKTLMKSTLNQSISKMNSNPFLLIARKKPANNSKGSRKCTVSGKNNSKMSRKTKVVKSRMIPPTMQKASEVR